MDHPADLGVGGVLDAAVADQPAAGDGEEVERLLARAGALQGELEVEPGALADPLQPDHPPQVGGVEVAAVEQRPGGHVMAISWGDCGGLAPPQVSRRRRSPSP